MSVTDRDYPHLTMRRILRAGPSYAPPAPSWWAEDVAVLEDGTVFADRYVFAQRQGGRLAALTFVYPTRESGPVCPACGEELYGEGTSHACEHGFLLCQEGCPCCDAELDAYGEMEDES